MEQDHTNEKADNLVLNSFFLNILGFLPGPSEEKNHNFMGAG